jgi:hypothetical protein
LVIVGRRGQTLARRDQLGHDQDYVAPVRLADLLT